MENFIKLTLEYNRPCRTHREIIVNIKNIISVEQVFENETGQELGALVKTAEHNLKGKLTLDYLPVMETVREIAEKLSCK